MNLLQAVRKGDLDFVKDNIDSDVWFKKTPWSDYILLNNSIQFNRFKVSTFLLQKNCRVNRTDLKIPESTPLHRAIAKNNVELITELLSAGASVTVRDENGETPVHLAGRSRKPVQIVNALMPYIVTAPNLINTHGLTHLHLVCMSDKKYLAANFIKKYRDINRPVGRNSPVRPGFTPLHFAVFYGRLEIAYVLLFQGAYCHVIDVNGVTPLHLAFRKKNSALVNFMVRTSFINIIGIPLLTFVDDMGISYFHIICSQNDLTNLLDRYLATGVDINGCISFKSSHLAGCTPLHVAVQYKCTRTIQRLLSHGADITIRNAAGYTPVHHAFWLKAYDLIDLFVHEMARVANHENLDDMDGISFFHMSCLRDNPDILQSFIDSGCNVNLRIRSGSSWLPGCTPLHLAVRFEQPRNVDVLLKNHANIQAVDVKGETPLHYLCQWSSDKIDALAHIIQTFVGTTGNLEPVVTYLNKKLQILRSFVNFGVNVDVFDKSKMTPLFQLFNHRAEVALGDRLYFIARNPIEIQRLIDRNRADMFKLMLELKPNLQLRDHCNCTLLHRLAVRELGSIVPEQGEMAPAMLENCKDIDFVNDYGKTALYMAVENANEELVTILLEKNKPNVNFFVKSDEFGTPVAVAIYSLIHRILKPNIVNRLIERGADVNVRLNNGSTALHLAFGSSVFTELCRYMTLPVLICDLEIQETRTGRTPLHVATRVGDIAAVDWLLRAGAKVDAADRQGFIPLAYCVQEPTVTGPAYVRHYRRLEMAGLRSPSILSMFAAMFSRFVETDRDEYERQCLEEIGRLKARVINQYCTMYTFLSQSIHNMAYYVNNERVSAMLSSQQLCVEFPLYGPLIVSKYRKALARHKIQKQVVSSFERITNLPEIICDSVLEYLGNADAANVIAAAVKKAKIKSPSKKSPGKQSSGIKSAITKASGRVLRRRK